MKDFFRVTSLKILLLRVVINIMTPTGRKRYAPASNISVVKKAIEIRNHSVVREFNVGERCWMWKSEKEDLV